MKVQRAQYCQDKIVSQLEVIIYNNVTFFISSLFLDWKILHVLTYGKKAYTDMVNKSSSNNKTNLLPQIIQHKKDNYIWRRKSRFCLGTGTIMWRRQWDHISSSQSSPLDSWISKVRHKQTSYQRHLNLNLNCWLAIMNLNKK